MQSLAESSMQFGRRSVIDIDMDTVGSMQSASSRLGDEVPQKVSSESLLRSSGTEKVGERVHLNFKEV